MTESSSASMRINKFLSAAGYCSRREADRLIEAGEVTVDGETAVLGTMVGPGEHVRVKGKDLGTVDGMAGRKQILIAVNKPAGIVCTTSDKDHAENIVELVDYPERIFPIGRLDKDSEGLILLTNEGELVNEILRGANYHEKEYLVKVDRALTDGFIDHMRRGVHLDELQITTRPCKVVPVDRTSFTIVLTQGLNRQIRRMCEALGFHVVRLERTRIMNIRLGSLKSGTWRNVTQEEKKTLLSMLKKESPARDGGGADEEASAGAERRRAPGAHGAVRISGAEKRREDSYRERQRDFFRSRSGEKKDAHGYGGRKSYGPGRASGGDSGYRRRGSGSSYGGGRGQSHKRG